MNKKIKIKYGIYFPVLFLLSQLIFWVMFDYLSYSIFLKNIIYFVVIWLSLNKVQTKLIILYIWTNILNKKNGQT
jgi:hypothetical protein